MASIPNRCAGFLRSGVYLGLSMVIAHSAAAADYWVAATGADSNPGTAEKPFATIQRALGQAQAGTTITVGPGVFYERITLPTSGEPDKPITLRGTMEDGRQRTRIEGGRKIDASVWEPAPEIAPGVFKTTALKEEPEFITIDGLSLARLAGKPGSSKDYGDEKLSAMEVLAWPDGPVAKSPVPNVDVWAALGGAYTFLDGTTYVRLKNGTDPRQHSFAASPQGSVVTLRDTGHIILKDLEVGGGETGIAIEGAKAIGNRIEGCRIVNGRVRVRIAELASGNVATGNYLSMGFLGERPGPWTTSANTVAGEDLKVRRFLYRYFKTFASDARTSDDKSFQIADGAVGNVIEQNELDGGIIGIEVRATTNLTIRNNRIHNFSSVGMALRAGASKVYVSNNEITDCNISIRLHEMNDPAGHELYIWGNRCVLPPEVGMQLFCHFFEEKAIQDAGAKAPPNIAFVYHNTFVGGTRGVTIAPKTVKNFPELIILNNIFAGQEIPLYFKEIISNEGKIVFAHNWILDTAPSQRQPGWQDATNIVSPENIKMDAAFVLTGANAGKEFGVDVSKPFTIRTRQFEALPGFQPGYFAGTKPDLGAIRGQ